MPNEFSSSTPTMSAATKEVLVRVRRMIPPMLETFHKGSLLPEAS